MHLFDIERRFLGGYGIVGGNLPLAAGVALPCDYTGTDDVVVCMFGDGATNQGTFGETMNLAALWNLPVVFMVINNQFGMGTALERHSAVTDLSKKARASACRARAATAWTCSTCTPSRTEALRSAREERSPQLVEAVTYRFRGHSMADPEEYRTKEQVEEWRKRDPIATFADRLVAEGVISRRTRRAARQRGRSTPSTRPSRFADDSPLPRARLALRRHLRARRAGARLVVGRRALPRRAPRRGRALARRARAARSRGRRGYAASGRRAGRERRRQRDAARRRRPGRDRLMAVMRYREALNRRCGRRWSATSASSSWARTSASSRARSRSPPGCSRSSARSACATRRSPRTRSSAWASAPR